jgi:hypothetical protein
MASTIVPLTRRSFGETRRKGAWWLQSLLTFLALAAFVVYSTWAAFQGEHYFYDGGGAHYLSPFYSPEIFGASPHAIFGVKPAWIPDCVLPAITIAAHITKRFGLIRPPVRWANRVTTIAANAAFP